MCADVEGGEVVPGALIVLDFLGEGTAAESFDVVLVVGFDEVEQGLNRGGIGVIEDEDASGREIAVEHAKVEHRVIEEV